MQKQGLMMSNSFSTKYEYNANILLREKLLFWSLQPFKHQFHKMVKHTQVIRRYVNELFQCVWLLCGIGA